MATRNVPPTSTEGVPTSTPAGMSPHFSEPDSTIIGPLAARAGLFLAGCFVCAPAIMARNAKEINKQVRRVDILLLLELGWAESGISVLSRAFGRKLSPPAPSRQAQAAPARLRWQCGSVFSPLVVILSEGPRLLLFPNRVAIRRGPESKNPSAALAFVIEPALSVDGSQVGSGIRLKQAVE